MATVAPASRCICRQVMDTSFVRRCRTAHNFTTIRSPADGVGYRRCGRSSPGDVEAERGRRATRRTGCTWRAGSVGWRLALAGIRVGSSYSEPCHTSGQSHKVGGQSVSQRSNLAFSRALLLCVAGPSGVWYLDRRGVIDWKAKSICYIDPQSKISWATTE